MQRGGSMKRVGDHTAVGHVRRAVARTTARVAIVRDPRGRFVCLETLVAIKGQGRQQLYLAGNLTDIPSEEIQKDVQKWWDELHKGGNA